MAVLIIREAGQPDRSFSTKKKEIFVGRGKSCDIILPHITVSKEHAKIYKLQDSYFIEDMSGQSNILVNQQQRQRFELSSKDEIQISNFKSTVQKWINKTKRTDVNGTVLINEFPREFTH